MREMPTSDGRSRALRLLVAYLTGALGVRLKELAESIFTSSTDKVNYSKISAFLKDHYVLSQSDMNDLLEKCRELLVENAAQVSVDYELILPILRGVGLDEKISAAIEGRYNERNRLASDREFIKLFRSNIADALQSDQENLHRRMGGIWYIVRLSTDTPVHGSKRYDVSLLNIKPTRYISAHEGSYENVRTHLLHFTHKAQFGNNQGHQTQRGRLFEVNRIIYFLGERHLLVGPSAIFMMAWSAPTQELPRRGGVGHAKIVQGIIMTPNAYDIPIVTSIVAKHVAIDMAADLPDHEQAELIEKEIIKCEENIGTYPENKIPCLGDGDGKRVVEILTSSWNEGVKEGFFRVFA